MTLSEFAHISNKKEKTIRKNKAKIPGVEEVDGELIFPAGTRYPYNLRGTRLDSTEKRIVTLLKATSREEYIDHTMLRMENVISCSRRVGMILITAIMSVTLKPAVLKLH